MTLARNASGTVLSASVEALMRRHWRSPNVIRLGELEFNRSARSAAIAGQPVKLTGREFALLDALAQAPGRVFTRDELSQEVWGAAHINGNRAIDAHMSRLTRKLREAGAGSQALQNVWGHGYKLDPGNER
jgi:DNA-binding response OmpR family regulator